MELILIIMLSERLCLKETLLTSSLMFFAMNYKHNVRNQPTNVSFTKVMRKNLFCFHSLMKISFIIHIFIQTKSAKSFFSSENCIFLCIAEATDPLHTVISQTNSSAKMK